MRARRPRHDPLSPAVQRDRRQQNRGGDNASWKQLLTAKGRLQNQSADKERDGDKDRAYPQGMRIIGMQSGQRIVIIERCWKGGDGGRVIHGALLTQYSAFA